MGYFDLVKLVRSNHFLEAAVNDARKMHSVVVSMVDDSFKALEKNDKKLAEKVIMDDDAVDGLDTEIRTNVLSYLSTMPVGGNVEFSLVLIDISTYLERIGDHAVWACRTMKRFGGLKNTKYLKELGDCHALAIDTLKLTKTALYDGDEKKAGKAIEKTEKLKKEYNDFTRALVKEKKLKLQEVIVVWSYARNLRRIGKYSKNIAETVTKPYPEAK